MVAEQLRRRGIESPRVLEAMGRVPRERFVPSDLQSQAYSDRALPIDCRQTISQPYIVGLMSEALQLTGVERVLEIGTGSGYQTAVLAELAREVVSIERHERLARQAAERLGELGYENLQLELGDGSEGWPARAPYDRIIITAATASCPPALLEQLADPGILVAPLGPSDGQLLQAIHVNEGQQRIERLTPCRFVPLI